MGNVLCRFSAVSTLVLSGNPIFAARLFQAIPQRASNQVGTSYANEAPIEGSDDRPGADQAAAIVCMRGGDSHLLEPHRPRLTTGPRNTRSRKVPLLLNARFPLFKKMREDNVVCRLPRPPSQVVDGPACTVSSMNTCSRCQPVPPRGRTDQREVRVETGVRRIGGQERQRGAQVVRPRRNQHIIQTKSRDMTIQAAANLTARTTSYLFASPICQSPGCWTAKTVPVQNAVPRTVLEVSTHCRCGSGPSEIR